MSVRTISLQASHVFYKSVLKPVFFNINPEIIHEYTTNTGEFLGGSVLAQKTAHAFFHVNSNLLEQKINGINFSNPIGLAAGFDYDAKLTQILHSFNFGFQTVGTITNSPYEGNPGPMLGRLPKSHSLMVNKGFKNLGANVISDKLKRKDFKIPLGISIGRTNSRKHLSMKESIEDILQAFMTFEKKNIKNSYYELNISCPNLFGDVTFYPQANLTELLKEVDSLNIHKPIFIKMPIERTDTETLNMLEVISKHNVSGVIIGNLQKNRKDPQIIPSEAEKFTTGYFSGKPTWNRSNELIKLSYKKYGRKLTIIGCGGVFSGEDAYIKIKLGASLVQLITGLVFEGPQLISQINLDLLKFLKRDKFKNISDAIGAD